MPLIRRLLASLVLITLTTGCATTANEVQETSSPEASVSNGEKSLVVHYLRYDGEYDPWNLWLWPDGAEGAVYEFTEEDEFGVVAKATVPGTASVDRVGIIVRTNDWAKDVAEDRFVDQFNAEGVAEIWLIQGEPEIYYSKPTTGPKFLGASIESLREIALTTNEKIDTSGLDLSSFNVSSGDDSIEIASIKSKFVNPVSSELILTLASDLDLGRSYKVVSDYFGTRELVPGGVYSSKAFEDQFHFEGQLGPIYSKSSTTLRVWAPTAQNVNVLIYQSVDGDLAERKPMKKLSKGVWELKLSGDQHLTVYNYEVEFASKKVEAVDPYVYSATVNGKRGVIVDLARTNPSGWPFKQAKFSGSPADAVIYELHVRDLGMNENSGITNKGKFLSLTEAGTKTPAGDMTGVDAIVDTGITHLQLIPIYDYASIDETKNTSFNWGYDPLNYNVPEGSYATDPYDPVSRIKELKTAISYMNSRGIRVIMDVVYNHVYDVSSHSFQKIVPGYYFRTNADGSWANGTGVGNEVASERSMARKFIVESATYWAREYRLGGFRFDLMGIHDVETMNQIRKSVSKIDPTFIIIGEGWNMGNILEADQKANQLNAYKMPGIAHFNDGIRDGLKGSVFNGPDNGWATGKASARNQVMEGIVGQIAYGQGLGGQWGEIQPTQSVTYVEAHDNLTLHDKLIESVPNATPAQRSQLHRFASSVALLAQGVAFVHAGQEFERSKDGDENSYKSPDRINALRWLERAKNKTTVEYFKGLIELRKAHPAFRMTTADQIRKNLKFFGPEQAIAYELNGKALRDSWSKIIVGHNPTNKEVALDIPAGNWTVVVSGDKAGVVSLGTVSGQMKISPTSTMVIYQR